MNVYLHEGCLDIQRGRKIGINIFIDSCLV